MQKVTLYVCLCIYIIEYMNDSFNKKIKKIIMTLRIFNCTRKIKKKLYKIKEEMYFFSIKDIYFESSVES